jgi:hypothetical protein
MCKVKQYRKKPVVIQAIRYNSELDIPRILEFIGESINHNQSKPDIFKKTYEEIKYIRK